MDIDSVNALNMINLLFALSALPADVMMIRYLNKIDGEAKGNLLFMFIAIFLASLFNALYYTLRFFDLISPHPLANKRSVFVNFVLTALAWSFVFLVKKLNNRKK